MHFDASWPRIANQSGRNINDWVELLQKGDFYG